MKQPKITITILPNDHRSPILHEAGLVTYWSVYEQRWIHRVGYMPDRELAALHETERRPIIRHFDAHAEAVVRGEMDHEIAFE